MHTKIHHVLFIIALMASAVLVSSCADEASEPTQPPVDMSDDNPEPEEEEEEEEEEGCTEGFLGCGCINGSSCWPGSGWVCEGMVCVEPVEECELGSVGCGCYANDTCDEADGEQLRCVEGVCTPPVCPAGTNGCPCGDGNLCGDDLKCVISEGQNICQPVECEVGQQGCPCSEDRLCEGGLLCQLNVCADLGCEAGEEGCACTANFGCGEGLVCGEGDLCIPDPCPVGQEGCACNAMGQCGQSSEGERLSCEDGVCAGGCAPGSPACACLGGDTCDEGAQCNGGKCTLDGCINGSLHCECSFGGCNRGLFCLDDTVCIEDTGRVGGACLDNERCYPGGQCRGGVCSACVLGSHQCGCQIGDLCEQGLFCQEGLCLTEDELIAPPSQTCYSPCSQDLIVDGDRVNCNSDGLMEGCIDGLECVDGSCVGTDEPPRSCDTNTDCPEWQTCIPAGDFGSRCYSNCELDSDCMGARRCHQKVCRLPCVVAEDNVCFEGDFCSSSDGVNGFCLPLGESNGETQTEIEGQFTLSTPVLNMTNVQTESSFVITNESATFETFTIRKRSHTVFSDNGGSDEIIRINDGDILCDEGDPGCVCQGDLCLCEGAQCACSVDEDCLAGRTQQGDPLNFGCQQGACRPLNQVSPLFWLGLAEEGEAETVGDEIEVNLEAGASATIEVTRGAEVEGPRWDGRLEVLHPEYGKQDLNLFYNEVPEGQWAGQMTYLSVFGTRNLEEWRQDRDDAEALDRVRNALIQRWGAFRNGRISWDEMQAVFTAVEQGSWRFANVQEACDRAACYLYDIGEDGIAPLSSDLNAFPVPSGVTELPIALNLRIPDPDNPTLMSGRIESSRALHYEGKPSLDLSFLDDPNGCTFETGGNCVVMMDAMDADIVVGGRYMTTEDDDGCASVQEGYGLQRVPWLLPGFQAGTSLDDQTGLRYQYECRDLSLPFASEDPQVQRLNEQLNSSLAFSNPIPDGRSRKRKLSLIDGALINQSQLVILFEERFDSFLGDDGSFSAYGFMILNRNPTTLDPEDADDNGVADVYEGSRPSDERVEPQDILAVSCDEALLETILGRGASLEDVGAPRAMVNALITGSASDSPTFVNPAEEVVHYLCHDTGVFNAGPTAQDEDGFSIDCPPESEVEFFTVSPTALGGDSATTIAEHPCNDDVVISVPDEPEEGDNFNGCDEFNGCNELVGERAQFPVTVLEPGSCLAVLNQWRRQDKLIQNEVAWRCSDPQEVFCESDRLDLRNGKSFYSVFEPEVSLLPLMAEIENAFRYKTRFRNQRGENVGFAPEVCVPNSDIIPYCYDPAQIEEVVGRIDCVLDIWKNHYDALDDSSRQTLDNYLEASFSFSEERRDELPAPIVHDGFERLYVELLITLGDDAFTKAFASRFDLAGANTTSFEGSLFEDGGVDLAGAVGFEMHSLYQAAQYYQKGLDRFYSFSPLISESNALGVANRNFVTLETVVTYFEKLTRASTQKARTWSQVALRYQGLNRADLARLVAERAYTAAYLESVVLSRMMLDFLENAAPEDKAQVEQSLEKAQIIYRAALLDMENVYSSITDELTIFGFAPDFIPFPAIDNTDFRTSNAFEVLMRRVETKMSVAREREEQAISQDRSFETDAVQFQSELTQIRNNYENQLGDICGTFEGTDGRIYPAITRYAEQSPYTSLLGDPCGLVGNGDIFETLGEFEGLQIDFQLVQTNYDNIIEEAEIERRRIEDTCNLTQLYSNYIYESNSQRLSLEQDIRAAEFAKQRIAAAQSTLGTMTEVSKCAVTNGECATAAISLTTFLIGSAALEVSAAATEAVINAKQTDITELDTAKAQWDATGPCDTAAIEGNARMATILLRLKENELEALRAEQRMGLQLGQLDRLLNKAKRLQMEQDEARQLAVNVEAARNDPNVRIYKNDAIINAEISFDDAIREVFRLTRVFEYYTSQSYSRKGDLFLVRMIARGENNLENYLVDLQNEFFEFEEFFGLPDTRVEIVSLKNDIFRIPYTDEQSPPRSLSQTRRSELMTQRLTDPTLLDKNGYITIPFSTSLERLSPLTRNHKMAFVEVEIHGSENGDQLGRVYLRQKGTGVIRTVDDRKDFYRFDERTAVINTFFNGKKEFENREIYQNFRHRDRPFVNTHWELVINQRDEAVNQDINLMAITDIKLYFYYTDMTVF